MCRTWHPEGSPTLSMVPFHRAPVTGEAQAGLQGLLSSSSWEPSELPDSCLVLSKMKTAGAMSHFFLKSAGLWGWCLAEVMEMIS